MNQISFVILAISGALYGAAFLCHLAALLFQGDRAGRWGLILVRVGFLVHTFFFFTETKTEGFLLPVSNFGQVMAFFSWALAFVYLVLLVRSQSESFGLILAPLLALLVGTGLVRFNAGPIPLPHPLNPYFVVHLATAFFAYASFTLSFAAAALYLFQSHELKKKRGGTFYHKLPSLEALEGLIFPPMAWGVFLLGLAVGVGLLWSKTAFGKFWIGDPKTLLTLGIGFFYLVLLFLHYGLSARGRRVVAVSLLGLVLIFVSFFGTRLAGVGLHQFLQ